MKSYAEGYEPSQHNPIQFILHIRHVHKSIVQMYIYSIFSYTQTTYSRSGFYLSSDQKINIATCVSCKTLLHLTRKDPVYQILIGPNLFDDLIFFRSDNNRSDCIQDSKVSVILLDTIRTISMYSSLSHFATRHVQCSEANEPQLMNGQPQQPHTSSFTPGHQDKRPRHRRLQKCTRYKYMLYVTTRTDVLSNDGSPEMSLFTKNHPTTANLRLECEICAEQLYLLLLSHSRVHKSVFL